MDNFLPRAVPSVEPKASAPEPRRVGRSSAKEMVDARRLEPSSPSFVLALAPALAPPLALVLLFLLELALLSSVLALASLFLP